MSEIVSKLRAMKCSEHGEHPTIKELSGKIEVTSCCDKFSQSVVEKYGDLLQKDALKQIDSIFKKFGR